MKPHTRLTHLILMLLAIVLIHCGSGAPGEDLLDEAAIDDAGDGALAEDGLDVDTEDDMQNADAQAILTDESERVGVEDEEADPSQFRALITSNNLVDISGHTYEDEIREVVNAGYWPLTSSYFKPDNYYLLNDLLVVTLKAAGFYEAAIKFTGGQCPSYPLYSYAISKGIQVSDSCPSAKSLRTVSHAIAAAARSFRLMSAAHAAYYDEMVRTYDGPSIGSNTYPYGVYHKHFKFAYMIGALPGWSVSSSAYGNAYIKRGQAAAVVYRILMYDLPDSAPTSPTSPSAPAPSGSWWKPTAGTTWQIQFSGLPINTSYNVQAYDIDLFDTPQSVIDSLHSKGRKVICYFSAGSYEDWRPDASKFTSSVKGASNGWPGEAWLDIRNLSVLGPIMTGRFDLAKSKKCDAIDVDNVDSFTNYTGFPLTYNDQLVYNKWLAARAHERGMAIGLKNDLLQIKDLVSTYDFSISESCFAYDECYYLDPFIDANKPVFGLNYEDSPSSFCPEANAAGYSFLRKNNSLDAWSQACWNY